MLGVAELWKESGIVSMPSDSVILSIRDEEINAQRISSPLSPVMILEESEFIRSFRLTVEKLIMRW